MVEWRYVLRGVCGCRMVTIVTMRNKPLYKFRLVGLLDSNILRRWILIKTYNFKEYEIRIHKAPEYSFDSTDNKPYDKIIVMEESDFHTCIEIEVEHNREIQTVLIIAAYHIILNSFVALHKNGLFMMLNEVLCIFNPDTLSIDKQIEINPIGTMFEVHPFGEDYILYGELNIYRISSDLNVEWNFSGRDIFVKYTGDEPAFMMKEDKICLYDFEDNYYEIGYDGKVIVS